MKNRLWFIASFLATLCTLVSLPATANDREDVEKEFKTVGLSAVDGVYDKDDNLWVIVKGSSGDCGALYVYKKAGGNPILYKSFSESGPSGCNPVAINALKEAFFDDFICVVLDNNTVYELDTTAHTDKTYVLSGAIGVSDQVVAKPSSTSSASASKTVGYLYVTVNSGTIYRSAISSKGALTKPTLIFTFPSGNFLTSPAVVGADGALYGVTQNGGTETPKRCGSADSLSGCGLVYRVKPVGTTWTEDVLYTFQGGSDGSEPNTSVAFDNKGNVYGTTLLGGDLTGTAKHCEGPELGVVYGCGEVYMLHNGKTLPWKETTLHAFRDGTDGAEPFGPVMLDKKGNVYGTTIAGGNLTQSNCLSSALSGQAAGCGVVFELAQGTWSQTVLYAFKGQSDGSQPTGSIALGQSGEILGTTWAGGDTSSSCFAGNGYGWGVGCGVIYKLLPNAKDDYPTFAQQH